MQTIIGKEFPEKVIPLIDNAKTSIKIIVFDWRFYPDDNNSSVQNFNRSIFSACKRGVEVKALVNSESLLACLKQNGVQAKKIYSVKLMHAKMILIDDEILVIGSHNYTQSAFTMNLEISVIVPLDKDDKVLSNYFKNIWPL
jgi:phosphatidylserine/phosphatidylglycerophosphate/cardiolipin synthase-like enzyme